MPNTPVDYSIPSNWSPSDVVTWINVTLTEPGVTSVEITLAANGWLARVHY